MRPSSDVTFMSIAEVLARRSTCQRAAVGALIVSPDGLQILGIGYNGAPRGQPNECHSRVPGMCGCIHAELNAILKAPGTLQGMALYTTHSPCLACARLILNTGVTRVLYYREYRDRAGIELLLASGVAVDFCAPDL